MLKIDRPIVSAVLEFNSLQRPTLVDKKRLTSLVLGHLDLSLIPHKKRVCALLASNEHAPVSLLLSLCELPAEICRPLLLGAKALSNEHLDELVFSTTGLEKARILARNRNISPAATEKLRNFNDQKIDQAIELRQPANLVEQTSEVLPDLKIGDAKSHAAHLLSTLDDDNDVVIHTALSDALGLTLESISALCSNPTSRNLPIALHFLRLQEDDAWSIYERVTRGYPSNNGIKSAFLDVFCGLETQETMAVVNQWQMEELIALLKINNVANDTSRTALQEIA